MCSTTAIERLAKRVWHGGRARVTQLFSTHGSPKVPIARLPINPEASSPLYPPIPNFTLPASELEPRFQPRLPADAKLPLEIVETIISHLIYDTHSLLACSLTCYSWYIASVPHLHHTLVVRSGPWSYQPKLQWPTPLQNASELNLLPFVKKFRIRRAAYEYGLFLPKKLDHQILHQISGMTNVRELDIDDLDIPSFMLRVRHYFGHFLPRVQSLGLRAPRGSCRQIIFFIGLFEHLEDLTLTDGTFQEWQHESVDNQTLIPPFTPPLRGRLVMAHFARVNFLKDMIDLFRGVQFRYVDLFDVGETQLLLNACAETLETLRLYPADPCGEQI